MNKQKQRKKAERIRRMGGYTKDDIEKEIWRRAKNRIIREKRRNITLIKSEILCDYRNEMPEEFIKNELIRRIIEAIMEAERPLIVWRVMREPEYLGMRYSAQMRILVPEMEDDL